MEFIEKTGTTKGALEKKCDLPNATFKNKMELGADLTSEIVDKISAAVGDELSRNGYEVINVSPFEKPIWIVVNSEEKERMKRQDSPTRNKNGAQHDGQAPEMSFIETSLASLLEGQNEIRAQLQTIHRWDAEIYGGGDDEKEAQARLHIGMLYAESLSAYKKKGIRSVLDR